VFVELMPLLKQRTLLITVARVDERLKVNLIPVKAKEGEDEALTTPLSYTGSPEELDRELGQHLASYVDSYLALGSTLADAKAEIDAAAKAARQRAKTAQQTSKPDIGTRKEESATPVAARADSTPSLFPAQTGVRNPHDKSMRLAMTCGYRGVRVFEYGILGRLHSGARQALEVVLAHRQRFSRC